MFHTPMEGLATMPPIPETEEMQVRRQVEIAGIQGVDAPELEQAEAALHLALYTADNWGRVVSLLEGELGLAKADLARAAGVTPMTISRWLEATEDADVRSPERLSDLRYVVLTLLMQGVMSTRFLRFWLAARDVVLKTDPLSAIAEGRFEEVIEAGRTVGTLRRRDPA
jgi:transcriptional regulator with XRE-family HTH domain